MNIDFNCKCQLHIMRILINEGGIAVVCYTAEKTREALPVFGLTAEQYKNILKVLKTSFKTLNTSYINLGDYVMTVIVDDVYEMLHISLFKTLKHAVKRKSKFDISITAQHVQEIINKMELK